MTHPVIRSLEPAIAALEKWQREARTIFVAGLYSVGPAGSAFFVMGDLLPDISSARVAIKGWGCAAFSLVEAKFDWVVEPVTREAVRQLSGREVDWSAAITATFTASRSGPMLLVIWSERQPASTAEKSHS